jgi:hypothetical protein
MPEATARPARGERRTIRIDSRPAPRRRPSPTAAQIAAKPDRVALWAVGLGLFMAFMAVVTGTG